MHLEDYNAVFLNRLIRRGGGVCIFIKQGINYELLDDLSLCTSDIGVICLKCGKFLFAVVYRPPDGNLDEFFEQLDAIFSHVNIHQYKLILGGNLNIGMHSNTSKQSEFCMLLDLYLLSNVILQPTRISATSATLLGLSITNLPRESLFSGTINITLSDNLPIY